MNLPIGKKIKVEKYVGGLSKIGKVKNPIKLSANESALGPSPKVTKYLMKSFNNFKRYPDGNGTKLKKIIAKKNKLKDNQIILGSGSDEILSLACQAYLEPNDEIIVSEFSFLMYRIYAQLNSANVKFSKESNMKFSIEETLKLINNRTKIIFIANPNNPTGTYLNSREMITLRNNIPENILLVVDDAYCEYVKKSDYRSGLDLFKNSKNVLVTRTFSKIYGLANLRLGWGFASLNIIEDLNNFKPPFNISGIGEEAACIALADRSWLKKNQKHNIKWSKIIYKILKEKKINCNLPLANFFLMNFDNLKINSDQAFKIFAKNRIILRKMNSYKIKNSLRFTIGNDIENKIFVKVLKENF